MLFSRSETESLSQSHLLSCLLIGRSFGVNQGYYRMEWMGQESQHEKEKKEMGPCWKQPWSKSPSVVNGRPVRHRQRASFRHSQLVTPRANEQSDDSDKMTTVFGCYMERVEEYVAQLQCATCKRERKRSWWLGVVEWVDNMLLMTRYSHTLSLVYRGIAVLVGLNVLESIILPSK